LVAEGFFHGEREGHTALALSSLRDHGGFSRGSK